MLKMADACQRAGGQQTRFHEMHVQRHNNVTILYADIVNFTPLSEQLTASDLVKTLNELFGRFDQIAQVRVGFFFVLPKHHRKMFVDFDVHGSFVLNFCRKTNACVLKFSVIVIIVSVDCQYPGLNMLPTALTWVCK